MMMRPYGTKGKTLAAALLDEGLIVGKEFGVLIVTPEHRDAIDV